MHNKEFISKTIQGGNKSKHESRKGLVNHQHVCKTLESLWLLPRILTIRTIDELGFASYLHSSNRCSTRLGFRLGQSLLIQVSPFFSLLNLLLVRLDLGLQLINESLPH